MFGLNDVGEGVTCGKEGGVLVRIHTVDVDFQTPAFIIDNDIVLSWHGSLAPEYRFVYLNR